MQALYHITPEDDLNSFILASNEHLSVSNSHGHMEKIDRMLLTDLVLK